MNLYDKDGNLICGVCGDHWANHSVGGDCNKLPLSEHQIGVMRKVFTTSPPKPSIQQVIAYTSR